MYSAEVWRDCDTEILFGITNRILSDPPSLTEKVKSFPWAAETAWEERVSIWVFELLDSLDYNLGLVHVEFIETAGGFELVEINPRMAGAMISPGILRTTNFNPYALVVNQALGRPIDSDNVRIIKGGYSHVSIYATRAGTIKSIDGIENIDNYPGHPSWIPGKTIGDCVVEVGTYRARLGNVIATGSTAELAQERAISAAQSISVEVRA